MPVDRAAIHGNRRLSCSAMRFRLLPILLFACTACSTPRPDPIYGPYRSLIEVVAELEVGVNADLYRFDPPTDVTGENLYRATLARLTSFENLVSDPSYRPTLRFAEARAHERLFDFGEAAALYDEVGRDQTDLGARARDLAPFARRLATLTEPLPAVAPNDMLKALDDRRAQLVTALQDATDDPRRSCVLCCIERLDVRKREYLWRARAALDNGVAIAIAAARDVVSKHVDSRRVLEHSLRLADMYAELARAYVAAVDPASHEFNAAQARNLIQSASQVYAEVAAVDGKPEREEARAALVALESLSVRIGGERP